MEKRLKSQARDWNSIRDNKNGCRRVIENLERAMEEGPAEERLRSLLKIETSLSGEGYFCSKLLKSSLLDTMVGLLQTSGRGGGPEGKHEDDNSAELANVVARTLARACKFNMLVLNRVGERYFDQVTAALTEGGHESLYDVVERMAHSPRWVRELTKRQRLMDYLTQPGRTRFEVLERIPDAAVVNGAVPLCLEQVERCGGGRLRHALRCLQAMTYSPAGSKEAIQGGGVGKLVTLLRCKDLGADTFAPALACLTNLMEDPTQGAKDAAVKLQVGEILHTMLAPVDISASLESKDQVLFALQATAVYCSHVAGRAEFCAPDRASRVEAWTRESCGLVARTASNTMQVIQWTP